LRGRGAQSALIAARLEAARRAGCHWACVETSADTPEKPNPSTHNLRRLGFTDAYERPNWVKVLREE
jgi:GNAT superfamily N-acetyltransferase